MSVKFVQLKFVLLLYILPFLYSFLVWCKLKRIFILYETFFAKSQERYNKYRMNSGVFIVQVVKLKKTGNIRFLIEKDLLSK